MSRRCPLLNGPCIGADCEWFDPQRDSATSGGGCAVISMARVLQAIEVSTEEDSDSAIPRGGPGNPGEQALSPSPAPGDEGPAGDLFWVWRLLGGLSPRQRAEWLKFGRRLAKPVAPRR